MRRLNVDFALDAISFSYVGAASEHPPPPSLPPFERGEESPQLSGAGVLSQNLEGAYPLGSAQTGGTVVPRTGIVEIGKQRQGRQPLKVIAAKDDVEECL